MPHYPDTRRVDVVDLIHGTSMADPYRWLEDVDAQETADWVSAQNALTEAWIAGVGQREALRQRVSELWDHPRSGAPWRRGERWFQLRNTGLQDQDVLWVVDDVDDADARFSGGRVLLDPNALSEDGTVALTGAAVSRDGELLAYATSAAGSDWMTWRVRRVADGTDTDDVVRWGKFSNAAWAPDGSGFWYGRYQAPAEGQTFEQANRGHRLHFHRLGRPQADDALVVEQPDHPDWLFDASVSHDGAWLHVDVREGTDPRSRVWVRRIDAADPSQGRLRRVLDAFDAAYDVVGIVDDVAYVRTDADAPNGRIVAVPLTAGEGSGGDPPPGKGDGVGRRHWREVVPEGPETLEWAHLVGRMLLVVRLHHGAHTIERFDLGGTSHGRLMLPPRVTVTSITGRPEDRFTHIAVTSFTSPRSVLCHDLVTGGTTVVHDAALAGAQTADLRVQQVFVDSTGGVRVPLTIVARSDVHPDHGPAPTWLYGYGGFNVAVTPSFKPEWLAWIEQGGVLAVANLRGGGEYGREWHDAGRLHAKQNVFDDAFACADWLVEQGWTTRRQLALHGRSNGGLLVGACMTQRPDAFGACVPEVGVLDMLRFHTFTIGWAWTSDYGSAEDPDGFATLRSYSPLHNIRPGTSYPPTLVTTGDHDDRVVPGHSYKFVAALQAAQAASFEQAPVLIRVETRGGHGAGKPVSLQIAERVDVLAFLSATVGAVDRTAAAL